MQCSPMSTRCVRMEHITYVYYTGVFHFFSLRSSEGDDDDDDSVEYTKVTCLRRHEEEWIFFPAIFG